MCPNGGSHTAEGAGRLQKRPECEQFTECEDGAMVGKTECGFAAVALLSTWHLDKSGFGRWFDHQLLHQPSKH